MRRALCSVFFLLVACGSGNSPPDAPIRTDPIDAPAMQWTWVDFAGSRCMNGSDTGLAVNLNPASDKVVLYLEGGGACFNALTCAYGTAHPNGYGSADFQSDLGSGMLGRGLFDRADPDNPFKDFSFVFVPYCSGDVFAGDNLNGPNGRQFLGFENVHRFLGRLVPTFRGASEVVLAGSSAGGVGATYNYDQVAQAFGQTPVELLDDSGFVLSDTYMKPCEQELWRDAWNLAATLPKDCADCTLPGGGGLVNLAIDLAKKYPDRRFAMIASEQDAVFRQFFSFGYSPGCDQLGDVPADVFQAGVDELRDQLLAPYPNFRMYSVASTQHVYLGDDPLSQDSSGGVKLSDWLGAVVDGGTGFVTVKP